MDTNNTNTSNAGIIGTIIVLLIILIGAGTYLYYNKAEAPTQPVDDAQTAVAEPASNCGLTVESPLPGEAVSFPVTVKGTVNNTDADGIGCRWTLFEGQAGVATLHYETKEGYSLAVDTKPITLEDEWMTEGPVDFSFELDYDNSAEQFPAGYSFKIILTEEDPSGMGQADVVEVPVVLK